MNTDEKRKALVKAYSGYAWHEKVAGMSSEQVVAVYLRFERDGWPNVKPKQKPDPKSDKPDDDQQIRLF